MGEYDCHAAIVAVQALEHVQHEGVVALGAGGDTHLKTLPGVHGSRHLLLLLTLGIQCRIGQEAAVPLVEAERRVGHHRLELHQLVILHILRIGEGVALPDLCIIHAVQEHVHGTQCPGLSI